MIVGNVVAVDPSEALAGGVGEEGQAQENPFGSKCGADDTEALRPEISTGQGGRERFSGGGGGDGAGEGATGSTCFEKPLTMETHRLL